VYFHHLFIACNSHTFSYLFCARGRVCSTIGPRREIKVAIIGSCGRTIAKRQMKCMGSGIDFLEIPMELWLNKGGSLEEGTDDGILLLIENDIDLL
jgi:hypothetical protein